MKKKEIRAVAREVSMLDPTMLEYFYDRLEYERCSGQDERRRDAECAYADRCVEAHEPGAGALEPDECTARPIVRPEEPDDS